MTLPFRRNRVELILWYCENFVNKVQKTVVSCKEKLAVERVSMRATKSYLLAL